MRLRARQRLKPSERHKRSSRHAWLTSNSTLWIIISLSILHTAMADTVTVYNPEDLRQAVKDGAQDIILANHLDVSTAAAGGYDEFLLDIKPSTRSIRVQLPDCRQSSSYMPRVHHRGLCAHVHAYVASVLRTDAV